MRIPTLRCWEVIDLQYMIRSSKYLLAREESLFLYKNAEKHQKEASCMRTKTYLQQTDVM